MASNAAFYLIFRVVTLFLTDWVIFIALLVKRKDDLPDEPTATTYIIDTPHVEEWTVEYGGNKQK